MIKMQTLILEALLFYNKLVYSMNLRISCSSCSRACVTVGGSWGLDALNKNNDYVKKNAKLVKQTLPTFRSTERTIIIVRDQGSG